MAKPAPPTCAQVRSNAAASAGQRVAWRAKLVHGLEMDDPVCGQAPRYYLLLAEDESMKNRLLPTNPVLVDAKAVRLEGDGRGD